MEQKKLLLTGSHAGSTAVAVIEEIKKRKLDWELHWVGKQFATEGSKIETLEFKNLSKLGVIFHNLESGKIQTKFTRYTIPSILKIPLGFIKGRKIVKEINPDLTLSFGSAAGAIISFWSNFLNIPVIIHEQTSTAGRANIISSYFANTILISREPSQPFFSKRKTKLVGNPMNIKVLNSELEKRNLRVKSILITGGSRGSTWINNAVKPILPRLLEKYFVIHQTGEANIKEFELFKNEILTKDSDKYFCFGQTEPANMAEILLKSDLVISRSGANTVWELIALKKPSILIPIPWSYNNEQTENAKYMENLGLASILPQKELSAQRLLIEIEKMVEEYPSIIQKTNDVVSPDINATTKVVDILQENIN